ncbi:metal-dependent hydrolase [Embleya sp. NPDC008237]|uniref:metal-dependent hydrolase n=1 Tax=Embleya sp. NPDC008237 TaxID=3363978 RepID=UPI0036E75454
MMGPAHSLSGACAWMAAGAAADAYGRPMPWPVLVVGGLICAGAALGPDLDHKAATVSRSFGPISLILCGLVDALATATYRATRKKGDPRRNGGHRTLTHTWVWALLVGVGASAICAYGGRWGVLGVLFVHMVLAIEGLLWRQARLHSDILVWLLGGTSTWMLVEILNRPGNGSNWFFTEPGREYWWVGLPIALGALTHCIGDALTVSGCPILWPIPIGRKRWYPLGPPKSMRFRAGAKVEVKVLMPLFMAAGGLGAVGALGYLG